MDRGGIFAIYTLTGNEHLLKQLILSILPDIPAASLFIPRKVVYRRIRGTHHKTVCDLFPSYLFLRCKDPEQIFFELKTIPKLAQMLHDGDYNFVPLTIPETNFMNIICSLSLEEHRQSRDTPTRLILPASKVSIVNSQDIQPGDIYLPRQNPQEMLKVLDGPLLKLAPYVKSVDYSNRKVILDVNIFGVHNIHIGIQLPKDEDNAWEG